MRGQYRQVPRVRVGADAERPGDIGATLMLIGGMVAVLFSVLRDEYRAGKAG